MMPYTPMDNEIKRIVESETQGELDEPMPTVTGGEGAVPHLNETEEALEQEGALDETEADLTDKD